MISSNCLSALFRKIKNNNKKKTSTILLKWNLIHFILSMAILLCTIRQITATTTPKITCDSISIDKKKYEKPKPKVAGTKITKDQWEKNASQTLKYISLFPYLLYCNIDVNLLHNFLCHHISQNGFVQLFKCTFQIIKMKKTKCLSFKKTSLLSAQKCMDFDGQPRLACNTEWCHNRDEIVGKLSCAFNAIFYLSSQSR